MSDKPILVIASRFNDMVTRALLAGAEDTLNKGGAPEFRTVWVPGAFEIPAVASKAAHSDKYSAIVCLGAVIKGDTPHFDYVAGQCASGLMKVSIDTQTPVIFGVLTTNTVEEALNRSGLKLGNKGAEAASTALEMIATLKEI